MITLKSIPKGSTVMMKYLSRLKRKRGFTLIELVIVIAIIVVLLVIMMANAIGGDSEKIMSAVTNAETFFPAAQLTMTKIQLTERQIVTYGAGDEFRIEYKDGANKILKGLPGSQKDSFIFGEVRTTSKGVQWTHVRGTVNDLMQLPDSGSMNVLDEYVNAMISEYIADSYDGYFYFVADNDYRVWCVHFSEYRLPTDGAAAGKNYFSSLAFTQDSKINERIVGTCTDGSMDGEDSSFVTGPYTMGTQLNHAFNAPSASANAELLGFYFS